LFIPYRHSQTIFSATILPAGEQTRGCLMEPLLAEGWRF
jgi:hypothetical protein